MTTCNQPVEHPSGGTAPCQRPKDHDGECRIIVRCAKPVTGPAGNLLGNCVRILPHVGDCDHKDDQDYFGLRAHAVLNPSPPPRERGLFRDRFHRSLLSVRKYPNVATQFTLTALQRQTIIHGLKVAAERFEEDAKKIKAEYEQALAEKARTGVELSEGYIAGHERLVQAFTTQAMDCRDAASCLEEIE